MALKLALVFALLAVVLLPEINACGGCKGRPHPRPPKVKLPARWGKIRPHSGPFRRPFGRFPPRPIRRPVPRPIRPRPFLINSKTLPLPPTWYINRLVINPRTLLGHGQLKTDVFTYSSGARGHFTFRILGRGQGIRFTFRLVWRNKVRIVRNKVYRPRRFNKNTVGLYMRRFVAWVRRMEQGRLRVLFRNTKRRVRLVEIRRIIRFRIRRNRGKFVMDIDSSTFRGNRRVGFFKHSFDFTNRHPKAIASLFKRFNVLLQNRFSGLMRIIFGNINFNFKTNTNTNANIINNNNKVTTTTTQNKVTSSSSTSVSGSVTTSYHKAFNFGINTVNGVSKLNAQCVISKNGKVVNTIKKTYDLSGPEEAKAKMEVFKANECKIPS